MTELKKKLLNYETVSYIIAGVLTTAVDYLSFAVINESLKRGGLMSEHAAIMTATAASWFLAVVFAYIVNKLIVFRNYRFSPAYLVKEASAFFAARIASGVITFFLMWVLTDLWSINEYLAKIGTSAFNLVFNYIASKLWIFKKAE